MFVSENRPAHECGHCALRREHEANKSEKCPFSYQAEPDIDKKNKIYYCKSEDKK